MSTSEVGGKRDMYNGSMRCGPLIDLNADLQVRCLAHIIHLVTTAGLKVMDGAIQTLRENIKTIRFSSVKKTELLQYYKDKGQSIQCLPKLDVPTRWNSTFEMLKSALLLKEVSLVPLLFHFIGNH